MSCPGRRFVPTLLVLILVTLPVVAQEPPPRTRLSYEQALTGGAAFRPVLRGTAAWAEDGIHLALDGGDVVDPLSGKAVETPVTPEKAEPKAANPMEAARTSFTKALGGRPMPKGAFQPRSVMSTLPRTPDRPNGAVAAEDGSGVAVLADGELWWCPKEGDARLLDKGLKEVRRLEVAPGGAHLSFIEGFDFNLVETATGKRTKLTNDGSENVFYGELDWVYQEEVYGRYDFDATFWSGSGHHVAFLRIDESAVASFTVVDHIPTRQELEVLKYPKAGDGNPKATLLVADADAATSLALDLSKYKPEEEILIVRVGWTPKGDRIVFQVQDREQRWLDLNLGDPATGAVTTLFRETSRSWVNVLEMPRWLADGSFLWESERSGYKHLYHYAADGKLLATLTSGDWQVKNVMVVDEAKKEVVFVGTKDGALDNHVYRVGFDGGGLARLTSGKGARSVEFNRDRSLFLERWSATDDPGGQRLCRADGTIVRELVKAGPPPGEAKFGMSRAERLEIPARDGYLLDAILIKPFDFDPAKSWPIWIETYSGPDAPTVSAGFVGNAWQQFLAQEGIMQLQVNVRSASGRGQHHTDTCYGNFGAQELKDLEDAIAWTVKNRAGDAARVGITGWSYGGFMTAYALTHSKAFKLGIAGAGVYDWRNYDTIYTERYMRTPQNNAEGYRTASCIDAAKDLHGHLVIVHGTIDDNVHVQNALQLAYALQKAGKDFEFMLYPKSRHGVGDSRQARHLKDLTWRAIKEHL